MYYIKKIFLGLLWLSIYLSLSVLMVVLFFNTSLGNQKTVTKIARESGVYKILANNAEQEVLGSNPLPNKLQLSILQNASDKTFTEDKFRQILEPTIGQTYNWLNGNTPELKLSIDTSPIKADFVANFNSELEKYMNNLPTCSRIESLPTDFTQIVCMPSGIDRAQAVKLITLLANNVISNEVEDGSSLNSSVQYIEVSNNPQLKNNEAFKQIPKYYQLSKKLPTILFGIIILILLIILALTKPRYFVLKKLFWVLSLAGAGYVAFSKLFGIILLTRLDSLASFQKSEFKEPLRYIVKNLIEAGSATVFYSGLALLIIGVTCLGLYIYINTRAKNKLLTANSLTPHQDLSPKQVEAKTPNTNTPNNQIPVNEKMESQPQAEQSQEPIYTQTNAPESQSPDQQNNITNNPPSDSLGNKTEITPGQSNTNTPTATQKTED